MSPDVASGHSLLMLVVTQTSAVTGYQSIMLLVPLYKSPLQMFSQVASSAAAASHDLASTTLTKHACPQVAKGAASGEINKPRHNSS